MSPGLQRHVQQLKTFYQGLERRRQVMLLASLGLTLAMVVGVGIWASRVPYETLLTSSDPAVLQATRGALDESRIPYKLGGDGRTVEVPTAMIGPARLEAAGAGAVEGLESLDRIKMGVTPRRELWLYQRALQGELSRTLTSLDEVQSARVHLVLPERTGFVGDQVPGSASVSIRLAPGRTLGARQVQGVTSLVAGAVEGLSPEAVVIVDEAGNLLSKPQTEDGILPGAGTLQETRLAQERLYAGAIQEALSPILGGARNLRATVSLELDHTMVESDTDALDPQSQVLISEQVRDEESQGARTGGVPGTESNLPERAPTTATGTSRNTSQIVSNYDYTRTRKRVVKGPGAVKRMNAAVVVNAQQVATMVAESGGALTQEAVRAELMSTIKAAIPHDGARGDLVQLTFLPFTDVVEPMEAAPTPLATAASTHAPWLAALAAIIFAFIFLVRPMMKRALAPAEEELAAELETEEDMPGQPNLEERLRRMVDGFEPVDASDLNDLVRCHPDASSQVVRQWLKSA